jgi:Flp pilus assembly protein TadB
LAPQNSLPDRPSDEESPLARHEDPVGGKQSTNDQSEHRRDALLLTVCSVVMIVAGVWLGQWMLPLLGVIFGARGVRGYRQPDLLRNAQKDLAARVIGSGSASADVNDRGVAAERLASLEDDLESLIQEPDSRIALPFGLTPVSAALFILVGMMLAIALMVNGDVAGVLFSIVFVTGSATLVVQTERTLARRKEAVEILRLQISGLRDRWPSLDAGERDAVQERALEP